MTNIHHLNNIKMFKLSIQVLSAIHATMLLFNWENCSLRSCYFVVLVVGIVNIECNTYYKLYFKHIAFAFEMMFKVLSMF